jgi:spermidine synthase
VQPSSKALTYQVNATLFVTGAAVMVVEILGTRVVGPVFGVGLFAWSALLSVTLLALAVGYYCGGLLADRWPGLRSLHQVVVAAGGCLALVPVLDVHMLSACEPLGPALGSMLSAAVLLGPALTILGMAGPVAARSTVVVVASSGARVGKIYALSTAGSLCGTLLTAHWLIPSFSTDTILLGTAGLLIAMGIVQLAIARRPLAGVVLLWPLGVFWQGGPALPEQFRLVDEANTWFGKVQVIDDTDRGVRFLRADHSIIGAQYVEQKAPAFAFVHVLEAVRFMRPEATSALQIGLGIGSLPLALERYGITVDVVEIDPEVVRMAKDHFEFKVRGEVFVEDARTFLRKSEPSYDVIVHDTFTGGGTPEHLLSLELLQQVRRRLNPAGILALNFVGFLAGDKAEASHAIVRTLRAVFPNVRVFVDEPPQREPSSLSNLSMFASDGELEIRVPQGASFEDATCERVLRSLPEWEVLKDVAEGELITDERNPLGRLQADIAAAHFTAMNELLPVAVWLN